MEKSIPAQSRQKPSFSQSRTSKSVLPKQRSRSSTSTFSSSAINQPKSKDKKMSQTEIKTQINQISVEEIRVVRHGPSSSSRSKFQKQANVGPKSNHNLTDGPHSAPSSTSLIGLKDLNEPGVNSLRNERSRMELAVKEMGTIPKVVERVVTETMEEPGFKLKLLQMFQFQRDDDLMSLPSQPKALLSKLSSRKIAPLVVGWVRGEGSSSIIKNYLIRKILVPPLLTKGINEIETINK